MRNDKLFENMPLRKAFKSFKRLKLTSEADWSVSDTVLRDVMMLATVGADNTTLQSAVRSAITQRGFYDEQSIGTFANDTVENKLLDFVKLTSEKVKCS